MWTLKKNDNGMSDEACFNSRNQYFETSTLTKGFNTKGDRRKGYIKKLPIEKLKSSPALIKSKSSSNLKFQTLELTAFDASLFSIPTTKHATKTPPQKLNYKNLSHTPFSTSNLCNSVEKLEKDFILFDGSQLENHHTSQTTNHQNLRTLPTFAKCLSNEERFADQSFQTQTIDRRFQNFNTLTNRTNKSTETSNFLTMRRSKVRNVLSKEGFKSESNLKHITNRPPRLPPRNNPFKQAFIRRLLLQKVHLRAFQLDFSNTSFKEGCVGSHAKHYPIVTSKNPQLSNIYVGDHIIKVGEKSLEGVTKDEFDELFKDDSSFKVTFATLKKSKIPKEFFPDESSNHTSQSTTPTNPAPPLSSPVRHVENFKHKRRSKHLHGSRSSESLNTNIYEEITHENDEEDFVSGERKKEKISLNDVRRVKERRYEGKDSVEKRLKKWNLRETRHASIDNDDVFLTFFEEPNGNGIFIQKQKNKVAYISRRSSEDDNPFRLHTDSENDTLSSKEMQRKPFEAQKHNLKRVVSTTSSGFVSEENISGSSIPSSNDKSPPGQSKYNPLEIERKFLKSDVKKDEPKSQMEKIFSSNEEYLDDDSPKKAGVKLKRSNGFKSEKSFEEKFNKPPPLPPKTYKKQPHKPAVISPMSLLKISNVSKASNKISFTISQNFSSNEEFIIENEEKRIASDANPSTTHLKNRLETNQFRTQNTFPSHKRGLEDANKNYENRFYRKNQNFPAPESRPQMDADDDDFDSNNHEFKTQLLHMNQIHVTSTSSTPQSHQKSHSPTPNHIIHLTTSNPSSPFHISSSLSPTPTVVNDSLLFEHEEFNIEKYKKTKNLDTYLNRSKVDENLVRKSAQYESGDGNATETIDLPPPLPPRTLRKKQSIFKEKIPENNQFIRAVEGKEKNDVKNEENEEKDIEKNEDCQVETWSIDEVAQWMERNCLGEYVGRFLSQKIDGESLLKLKRVDLVDLGMVEVKVRRDFERAVMKLKK